MSNTKYKKSSKIKDQIPLSTMWTANSIDKAGETSVNARRSFVLGWPTVKSVATFRYINLAEEKDEPKSVPLKIFTEDIKNGACSVTVTVTNSDTVNDVINMSLSRLGITGSEKDYQLWISSGKKKTSYPLAGHEHPYGIKMSSIPATGLLQQGLEDSTSASALQEDFLEGSQEIQDQFILKPRHSAKNQAKNQQGKEKKTISRSSVKNWAFWCSSRTRQDNQHPPLPPTKPKQLFGAPLEEVCDNDILPTQILNMLSFINQKGPFTEGIFRKSASIQSRRALMEKLNSGEKVNLDDESILVVASTLKDFLQSIPGSIFSACLYDKWLDVIDQGNEEEKITATQRLLEQLPRANVVFLLYLFGGLHSIEQHSSTNQMTAYNLSVCITPRILGLLNSGSTELENVTKKISFIQFLIENCHKIFGEDITSLFGENSVSCDNSDITDVTDNSEKVAVTTEQPVESKPVRVTVIYRKAQLQYDAMTSSRMGPSTDLSTVF